MPHRANKPDDHVLLEKVDRNGNVLESRGKWIQRHQAESLFLGLEDKLTDREKEEGVHWRIKRASAGTRKLRIPKNRGRPIRRS
jgi:hypothetical protein